MEKCKYCKKEFKKEEIDIHEFSCVSTFGSDNLLDNVIPCEICNQLIEFDKYNEHISICSTPRFYFNNIRRVPIDTNAIDNFLNELANNIRPTVNTESSVPTGDNNESLENESIQTRNNDETVGNNVPSDNVNIFLNSNIEVIRSNIEAINNLLNTRTNNYDESENYEELSQLDNNNVKRGLNIKNISNAIYLDNNIKCSICLEDFEKYQKMRKLNCNHILCEDCSEEWFSENVKCPVCMKELG